MTSALITLLAAGLAAQAVIFLQQAGVVTAWPNRLGHLGRSSPTPAFSAACCIRLIGYSDQPSVLQVVVYVATLATIFALSKAFAPRSPRRRAEAPAPQGG